METIKIDMLKMVAKFMETIGVTIEVTNEGVNFTDASMKIDIPEFIQEYLISIGIPDDKLVTETDYVKLETEFLAFLSSYTTQKVEDAWSIDYHEVKDILADSNKEYELEQDGN